MANDSPWWEIDTPFMANDSPFMANDSPGGVKSMHIINNLEHLSTPYNCF